jgi:class 3 adenylate cyclase
MSDPLKRIRIGLAHRFLGYPALADRSSENLSGQAARRLPIRQSARENHIGPLSRRHPAHRAAVGMAAGLSTVLFTDIVGSTELAITRGDESAHAIRRLHDRLVRRQLAIHGGREVQTTGDGFLVTFSSVRNAIACACAIQRAQMEHNHRCPDQALRLRLGLNAGEVSPRDDGLFGSAVNLAARVTAKAGPGEILVTEVVKQLAGTIAEVEFRDRGRCRLRGFPERLRLYQLVARPVVPKLLCDLKSGATTSDGR